MVSLYRVEQKKNLAKFSDTCSVRADGLCIGSPRLVGGKNAGNLNLQEFFCTTLYGHMSKSFSVLTSIIEISLCTFSELVNMSHDEI